MTKEQTNNWEDEFDKLFPADFDSWVISDYYKEDGTLEYNGVMVKQFISKTISQEKEKWNIALEQKFAGASLGVCEMIDEFIKESDNLLQNK